MKELRGKVAVVTGAASGIGLALATRFAAEGMSVVLADVDEARVQRARAQLLDDGAAVISVSCDVSSPDQVQEVARQTVSRFGAVHVVCNNAGMMGTAGRLWELDPDDWSRTLSINLMGVINGIRAFVPLLLEQGEGHVVNTASMAGLVSCAFGDYGVSKHAVVALSESLFHQLAEAGSQIGVSVLCPGNVRTNIASSERRARASTPDPRRDAIVAQKIAEGSDPAEIAGQVIQAVRAGVFYVMTWGDGWGEAVKSRFADIIERQRPTLPNFS